MAAPLQVYKTANWGTAITLPSNVTPGSILLIFLAWSGQSLILSSLAATQCDGGAEVVRHADHTNGVYRTALVTATVTDAGSCTLTPTWSGSADGTYWAVLEYESLGLHDEVYAVPSNQGTGAGAYSSGPADVVDGGTLIVALPDIDQQGWTVGPGFTARGSISATERWYLGDKDVEAAGTEEATATAAFGWMTGLVHGVSLSAVGGGTPGNAPGDTIASTASIVAGAATGAALADGGTMAASASIVSGSATGAALATGASMTREVTLIAGTATGDLPVQAGPVVRTGTRLWSQEVAMVDALDALDSIGPGSEGLARLLDRRDPGYEFGSGRKFHTPKDPYA